MVGHLHLSQPPVDGGDIAEEEQALEEQGRHRQGNESRAAGAHESVLEHLRAGLQILEQKQEEEEEEEEEGEEEEGAKQKSADGESSAVGQVGDKRVLSFLFSFCVSLMSGLPCSAVLMCVLRRGVSMPSRASVQCWLCWTMGDSKSKSRNKGK